MYFSRIWRAILTEYPDHKLGEMIENPGWGKPFVMLTGHRRLGDGRGYPAGEMLGKPGRGNVCRSVAAP